MLQEGLKNLNQGSLAAWAKMAGSWLAVRFQGFSGMRGEEDSHRFCRVKLRLAEGYIQYLVFVFRWPMVAMTATRSVVNSFKFKVVFTVTPDWA